MISTEVLTVNLLLELFLMEILTGFIYVKIHVVSWIVKLKAILTENFDSFNHNFDGSYSFRHNHGGGQSKFRSNSVT